MKPWDHRRNDQIKRASGAVLSDREWFSLAEIIDRSPRPNRHKRTILRDMKALSLVFPVERRVYREGKHEEFQYRRRRLRRPRGRMAHRSGR